MVNLQEGTPTVSQKELMPASRILTAAAGAPENMLDDQWRTKALGPSHPSSSNRVGPICHAGDVRVAETRYCVGLNPRRHYFFNCPAIVLP